MIYQSPIRVFDKQPKRRLAIRVFIAAFVAMQVSACATFGDEDFLFFEDGCAGFGDNLDSFGKAACAD